MFGSFSTHGTLVIMRPTDQQNLFQMEQFPISGFIFPADFLHLLTKYTCQVSKTFDVLQEQFPYYKNQTNTGWKNSIRHNLSLNKSFMKV